MRRVDRLKKLRSPLSEEYRKVDTSINGDVEPLVEAQRTAEKRLFPLRIDQRTVIYVTQENRTKEYAERKRKQFSISATTERKGGTERKSVDAEEIRTLVQSGMCLKDIAKRMGVSRTSVGNYIKKYELRDGKK